MPAASTTGFCEVPGSALYYERRGAGTPVVFLHGNPADLTVWDLQVPAFLERFEVVRYDLRGFGRSKPSSEPYSHADDLVRLLDHLAIDRACFVGWSMGGGALVNFSLLHPARVSGVVLVDSSLGGFTYSEAFRSSFAVFDKQIVVEHGLDHAKDLVLSHPFIANAMRISPAAELLERAVRGYSGWHWLNRDSGVPLDPPALQRLEEIRVPTLALVGANDFPDFLQIADLVGRRIPGARRLVLPGVGHAPFLEAPDTFNAAALGFLQALPSTAS